MTTAIIIFLICYALIVSDRFNNTMLVIAGAAVAIMLHQISYTEALAKIDLNVVFLLAGMMMIVNILSLSGIFEWSAITLARKARGNGMLIIAFFLVLTAGLSAVLDNVTTVILIAPITILICQILELPIVPILIMEAVFSNIGGTSTLIGDPPNILIGSETRLTFNDFLLNLTPVILLVMAASLAVIILQFRGRTATSSASRELIMRAQPERALIRPEILKRALPVFGLVMVGFAVGHFVNLEPGIVALTGAFVMASVCRIQAHKVLGNVEWDTILFFVGLFMLIGALEVNGVFEALGRAVLSVSRHHLALTALAILWLSAGASTIVNNIPLVIAMIPLIRSIVPEFAADMNLVGNAAAIHAQIEAPLYWSLALGACLGGNGTLIGASANVVVAQIANRNNYKLTFMQFTRAGLPYTFLSLAICTVYILLRYFTFN